MTTTAIATVPSSTEFDMIMRQAEMLAQSAIVPASYQRQPANIVAAALAGRPFGWDASTALRNVVVIQGTATIKPEALLGLIRRSGHSVSIERHADHVTVTGKRRDTGDTMTVTFSLADAQRAGLAGKGAWKSWPTDMCQWRAIAALARGLFSDVTLGLSYIPEEIGADVDVEGEVVTVVAEVSAADAKRQLLAALGGDVEAAKAAWGDRGSSAIKPVELEALLAQAVEAAEEQVAEAELVEETTVSPFDDPAWNTTEPEEPEEAE
jgi:hypothetical protein